MHYKTWNIVLHDGAHTIELHEDEAAWGVRSVVIDGRTRAHTHKNFLDLGRIETFDLAGQRCTVRFEYRGLVAVFVPELIVGARMVITAWDGQSIPLSTRHAAKPVDVTLFPPGSTSYKLWRFRSKGKPHRIELLHAWFSGHLHVRADDVAVVHGQRPRETATTLRMVVGDRVCTINMKDFGMERFYECMVDHEVVYSDAQADILLRGSHNPAIDKEDLLRPATLNSTVDEDELLRPEQA